VNQEEIDKQHLIQYRLERAKETLKDAQLLHDQGGSPNSIINRSYYAMFYASLALLADQGKESSKHSGVISLFDKLFIKSGKFPKTMSKAFHKAFDLRQISDYRELFELDQDQAEEVLQSARQFVESIMRYFSLS
jgi:uncharacterized protein (UPF0332 family)